MNDTTFIARASKIFLGSVDAAYKLAKLHGLPIIQARQDGSLSIRSYSENGRRKSRHIPAKLVKIIQDGEPFFLKI